MSSKKKNILFTFDYELFLGQKSGSAAKCCIEPTNNLIGIFDRYKIKNALFFVDTTYLLRLKENSNFNAQADFNKIKDQLQNLIQKGHYVFPHIHPHWLDAEYLSDINQWDLKNDIRYRFNALNIHERKVLFQQSVQLLYEIIHPVNSTYKIDAYRAGGWCIQPFTDFIPCFEEHNITADFSVLRGAVNTSEKQYFDFSITPSKDIYHFKNNPLIEENGKFSEYVISVLEIPKVNQFLNKILLKILWQLKQRSIGDGVGALASGGKSNSEKNKLMEMVSLELLTDFRLPLYLKYIDVKEYIQFISHPKMLSAYNLMIFNKFLYKFTRRYEFETDYKNMF
jgi:hypothetical protein